VVASLKSIPLGQTKNTVSPNMSKCLICEKEK
jgi:hypothetical protein